MQISRLKCPHCETRYPLWRVVCHRPLICGKCKAKLAFTVESAQRLGAMVGFLGSPIVIWLGLDFYKLWYFWALLVIVSFIAGGLILGVVGKLAPNDQVRMSVKKWDFLPNVSSPYRAFLVLPFAAIPFCALMLLFTKPPPEWVMITFVVFLIVAGILGSVGMWQLLFGRQGVFRKSKSDENKNNVLDDS